MTECKVQYLHFFQLSFSSHVKNICLFPARGSTVFAICLLKLCRLLDEFTDCNERYSRITVTALHFREVWWLPHKFISFKALCLTAVAFISFNVMFIPRSDPRKHRLVLLEFSSIGFWSDKEKSKSITCCRLTQVMSTQASWGLLLKSDLLKRRLYMSPLSLKITALPHWAAGVSVYLLFLRSYFEDQMAAADVHTPDILA